MCAPLPARAHEAMPKLLDQQQVAAFHRDGFVAPIGVLSAEEAAAYRRRFEKYERSHDGWYTLSKGQKIHLLQTWVAELVRNDRILDAVEDVLGPDVMCWGTSLFIKNARDPHYVSWHQDSTYWGLDKPDVVTAWVALSAATRESGCMKMMPGSHTLDQVPHRDTLAEHNLLTRGQEVAMEVDESRAVYVELAPGEISLHNVRTVHASEPNRSDDRRIGVALRYIAPHVRQMNGERDSAMLLRGEDRCGNFIHEQPPKCDMDADALAEHARIMQLRQDILYDGVEGRPAHMDD
jgi:ectoine hydroxylase-related dioxygenase (phytanoyl-CoA dioxygenase family)